MNRGLKGTETGLVFINVWKQCTEDFPVEGQKEWSESEIAFEVIQVFFSIIVVGKNQNLILDEGKKKNWKYIFGMVFLKELCCFFFFSKSPSGIPEERYFLLIYQYMAVFGLGSCQSPCSNSNATAPANYLGITSV